MYIVHYSGLEIVATRWRQNGVVLTWRHQTEHKHNARWWRAIPTRSRATLTQTWWLWWKFIVLRGNAEKQISVVETKDCCIKFAALF